MSQAILAPVLLITKHNIIELKNKFNAHMCKQGLSTDSPFIFIKVYKIVQILMHEIKNQLGVQNVEMQGRFSKQNLSNFFKLLQTHMELDSNYYRKNSDATSVLSIYCTKKDKEKFFDKLTALIENHIQIYERDLVFESGNAIKQTNIPQTTSQVFDKRDITTIIENSKEISHDEQSKQTPVINNDMTK